MVKVVVFFGISILTVIIKGAISDKEACVWNALAPSIEGCPIKNENDIHSVWDAEECAFRKIGLLDDGNELHIDKYWEYLKPQLKKGYGIFLKIELMYCLDKVSKEPLPDEHVYLAYRLLMCLMKDRDDFAIAFGCPAA